MERNCETCKHREVDFWVDPCKSCLDALPEWQPKEPEDVDRPLGFNIHCPTESVAGTLPKWEVTYTVHSLAVEDGVNLNSLMTENSELKAENERLQEELKKAKAEAPDSQNWTFTYTWPPQTELEAENERLRAAMRKARKMLKLTYGPLLNLDVICTQIDEARQILKEGLKTE